MNLVVREFEIRAWAVGCKCEATAPARERMTSGCIYERGTRQITNRLCLLVTSFIMAAPADFLNFIDVNKDRFIQRLASAVEIPRYYPPDHLA